MERWATNEKGEPKVYGNFMVSYGSSMTNRATWGRTAPRSCNKNPIAGPSNESTRFHDLRRILRFIRLFLLFRGKEPDLRIFLPGMERAANTDARMARSKFRRVSWLSSFVYRWRLVRGYVDEFSILLLSRVF